MFKIRDLHTQEWLHHVPWDPSQPIKQDDHTTSKGVGKVFKRLCDVSNHISLNSKFYGRHPKRFEVVKFELVEADTLTVEGFLAAKQARNQLAKAQAEAAKQAAREHRIKQLEQELASLKGSNK